ncbi:MAG: site-specific integrase [Synechococcaceae cyanobacterium]|nr:site-specific integrase [Synechococcaceae cyanobacterium]
MVPRRSAAAIDPVATSAVEPGGRPDLQALDARLAAYNSTLAAMGLALRIERRGGRLGLRGPLPLRQGEGLRVQRLSLGLTASPEGLEAALAQLRNVAAALEDGRFRWQDWQPRQPPSPEVGSPGRRQAGQRRDPGPSGATAPAPAPGPGEAGDGRSGRATRHGDSSRRRPEPPLPLQLAAGLAAFAQRFRDDPRRRRRPAGSRSTWVAAYQPYLHRLRDIAADQGRTRLSPELLLDTLESYPAGSAARVRCASALAALADCEGLELPRDWGDRSGGYGLHAARFRQLPSDAQILTMVEAIPNPGWRLVYGLMATYGLRNHEVFFADLSTLAPGGDRVLRVLPGTKTGEHQVWPFQPEWVERFELERLGRDPRCLPPVARDLNRTTLRQVGQRVSEQFRRYGLAVTPYDLRHAWAVRTIHIGLPDTVAARMMGHSVAIHTRTYHHWITRRDQQRAVDQALARQSAS